MKRRNMKSSKKTLKSTPSSSSSPTEIDRLSELPDELLLHILSFLDMDSVLHTTVLSKRWRYVWITLPSLNFDYVAFLTRRLVGDHQVISDKYINFIDKVLCLLLKSRSSIHKFCLSYNSPTSPKKRSTAKEGARINKLHQILDDTVLECNNTECKIQELVLKIHAANYQVPQCIYSCNSSLTTLKLEGIKLNLTLLDVSVDLPCLKTLCLKWIDIEEDERGTSFEKFISSCPVLQTLVFSNSSIRNTNDITISSVPLENLKIEYIRWQARGPCKVTIDAPNLVSFKSRDIQNCSLVWRRKSGTS